MKGQWYILSTVIILSIIVVIVGVYQSNRVISSDVVLNDISDIASNLKYTTNKIILTDCSSADDKISELEYFSQKELFKKGIFLKISKDIKCSSGYAHINMSLQSSNELINSSWTVFV